MKFRDLKTGDYFKFDNGVSTFNEVCRKMSARRYGWNDADGKTQMSSVGTINVKVAPCSSTPTGKGKAAMRKPQRLVVTPVVRPETQAAFILAQVAKSDIWYAEKFGPEHCTQCFSRAVSLGIVFG